MHFVAADNHYRLLYISTVTLQSNEFSGYHGQASILLKPCSYQTPAASILTYVLSRALTVATTLALIGRGTRPALRIRCCHC